MDAASSPNVTARILAVGALMVTWAALLALVTDRPEGATASAGYSERLREVVTATERMTAQLGRLEEGSAAAPALERVRAAMAALRDVRRWLRSTPDVEAGERLANALVRHHEYLDAVGSVLANPRSPLRHNLEVRAERVTAAYGALPDAMGLEQAAKNLDALERYVEWRRKRL